MRSVHHQLILFLGLIALVHATADDGHSDGRDLSHSAAKKIALLKKCNQTRNPHLCLLLTIQYAPLFPTMNDQAMFEMLMTATNEATRIEIIKITSMAAKPGTDEVLKNNLLGCVEGYNNALDSLKIVKAAASKQESRRLIAHLEVAKADYNHCDFVFEKDHTPEYPLAADTEVLSNAVDLMLDYAHLVFNA